MPRKVQKEDKGTVKASKTHSGISLDPGSMKEVLVFLRRIADWERQSRTAKYTVRARGRAPAVP